MAKSPQEMADVWGEIERKELAVLDDIGCRERVGDLAYRMVKKFADIREFNGKVASIFISNLRPKQLAEVYDDRVASRLLSGTVFELTGVDRRVKR
jgi:hypothetical protein